MRLHCMDHPFIRLYFVGPLPTLSFLNSLTSQLFDFGFCKELRKELYDKSSGFYNLSNMTGSPPYMAPENLLGKPYGKPADVFSFGVLVWEMLHCTFAVG